MRDRISVIVPVYNVESYLSKCVDSLRCQTYDNLDIILVDDGSTDGSADVCDGYASNDSRIRVIHKANGGLSDARNHGIDIAEGELIAFVDGDDWIHPQMYEILYEIMNRYRADIAACGYTSTDINRFVLPIESDQISTTIYTSSEAMINFRKTQVCAWNKLYRREIFENLRYPIGRLHEDEAILHRIYRKCNKVVLTEIPLYFYVKREGSIVHEWYDKRIDDALYALGDRVEFMEQENWKEVLRSAVDYYCEYCILGYHFSQSDDFTSEKYDKNMFWELERTMISEYGRYGAEISYRLFALNPVIYGLYIRMVQRFNRLIGKAN